MSDIDTTKLGRFGHHPNPAIDFCVEVECLEGLACDIGAGLQEPAPVRERISKAMDFRVGGDPQAVAAKGILRKLEERFFIRPQGHSACPEPEPPTAA